MGQVVRGDTIHDEERIKLLNKIITKLKEIEESIPVKIKEAIDALVDNSPEAYDTLKELYEGLVLQPDWEQSDNTKLDYIKNKPTIPEQVKSNWAENDNTKAGYIQNRTHYEDVNIIEGYETLFSINDIDFSPTERIGYKIINIDTNVFDIEFYKEDEFLTKERIISDGTTNIVLNTQVKLAIPNRDYYVVDNNNYYSITFNVQSQQISINGVAFESTPTNGIIYEKIGIVAGPQGADTNMVRKLKYDKIEENVHQLDIKYIPDSLIQRIEACEQALNITTNS